MIEGQLGIGFERPVRYMREHLEILTPQLSDEPVSFSGEFLTSRSRSMLPDATVPSVLPAALGPQMLRLAGRFADGTITWMTGPRTLANLTAPTINEAAAEAGRSTPRVVAAVPVCCTNDATAARAAAADIFAIYGQLPSYRAMIDREGMEGPEDLCIIGSEDEVATKLAALVEAGALFVAAC